MLSELLPRALLIVTVLALAVPAQAKGGAVSIGQSNPGTLDINRTIDPQTLVTQSWCGRRPNHGGGIIPASAKRWRRRPPAHRDKLRGHRSPERDGGLRRHWA